MAFISLFIVALIFVLSQKTEAPNSKSNTTQSATQPVKEKDFRPGGKYVDYSEAELVKAEGQRILFFHAPWCPQCRSIEKDIVSQGVPAGYTIFKVDYDTSSQLREQYEVTLQTTFIKIDAQGKLLGKYVAYNEPTFDAVKRDFL